MLYTVMPLERIYARPLSYTDIRHEKPKNESELEYRDVPLKHGRVLTRREGENYIIERVNSTDMSDYLNDEYVAGKIYKSDT